MVSRSDTAYWGLLAVLTVGTIVALTVEPMHILRGAALPNPLVGLKPAPQAVRDEVGRWTNTTRDDLEDAIAAPMQQMPGDPWPIAVNISGRPDILLAREDYWVTSCVLTMAVGIALGTAVVSSTRCVARASQAPGGKRHGGEAAGLLEEGGMMEPEKVHVVVNDPISGDGLSGISAYAVLCHLTIVTKVVATASWGGTLSADFGLPFEAYQLFLTCGMTWMLAQAVAFVLTRPNDVCDLTAFAAATLSTLTPFLADPFDTVKDAAFAGVAIAGGGVFTFIGLLSLGLLWAMHIYMLCDREGLALELQGAYASVLLAKRQQAPKPEPEAETATEASGGASLCGSVLAAAAKMRGMILVAAFKQSTPERRRALAIEDGPQGLLASIYSLLQGRVSAVLVMNVIIPAVRYLVALASYQPLLRCEAVQVWLLKEMLAADAMGHHAKKQSLRSHFRHLRAGPHSGAIAAALKESSTPEKLDLGGFNIGADGAAGIAAALKENRALKALYLHSNSIGDDGAASIAAALKENGTLKALDLGYNSIGDDGAASIAAALQENHTLEALRLCGNSIGDDGAASIAAALQENHTLKTLELHGNNISEPGKAAVRRAFGVRAGTLGL